MGSKGFIRYYITYSYQLRNRWIFCKLFWHLAKLQVKCSITRKIKKGWKVIKTLANYLEINGFRYPKIEDVQKEIDVLIQKKDCKETKFKVFLPGKIKQERKDNIFYFNLINNIYNSDNIVRRATSLQKTSDAKNKDFLFISEEYAKK